MNLKTKIYLLAGCWALTNHFSQAQIPAFPGAEGAGAVSIGGRGGEIIEVTNLNDSGPGSLRAACEVSGSRTVVFRVGGIINLKSAIRVFDSYLTVAGQTAPGNGIQIIGPNSKEDLFLVWEAHDIIIRYLRFRHGFNNSVKVQAGGCYNGGNGSYNIIIDHCSFSWGMNDLAGAWSEDKPVYHYTFSNNIFAEALDVHSTNLIFGSNTNAEGIKNIDVHHNLFGNSSHRSPLFKGKSCRVINNIMYNPGWYATGIAGGVTIDIIGNEYKQGPTNMAGGRNEVAWRSDYDGPNSGPSGPPSIYIAGNKGWSVENPSDDNWAMVEKCAIWDPSDEQLNQNFRRNSPMKAVGSPITVQKVNTLASELVKHVGASQRLDASGNWVFVRDEVDDRIINDYLKGTGGIPSHESEVGGFPDLQGDTPYPDNDHDGMSDVWETTYGFNTNSAADGNQDADGDGYTNIEEFLNGTVPQPIAQQALPTKTTVDAKGFIRLNGERFFPYGFYLEEKRDFSDLRQNIKTIGEAGFNIAFVEPNDNARISQVFDEAERQNVKLIYTPAKYIVEYFGLDSLVNLISSLGIQNESSLFGYNLADDVRDGKMTGQPTDARDIKRFHDAFKQTDPDHLTMVAIGGGTDSTIWDQRRWDVGGYQSYPSNGGSPLSFVYEGMKRGVTESKQLGQSPVGLLQTFNWDKGSAQRLPTPSEFRNMLYQALVAGVKGVIYYTYDKENLGIESDPVLWQAAQASVGEIETLRPFLLYGKRRFKNLGNNLWMASWEYQNELVATVVYTGEYRSFFDPDQNTFDTRSFSWKLPSGYTSRKAENLFPDYPTSIANQNGTASGSIRLLDVQVVKFSRQAPISAGSGLQYTLYNNRRLNGNPAETGVDATVNFNWQRNGKTTKSPKDNFSVRWTGQVQPKYSETYTFYTHADDGTRLWVNGKLLIDDWADHPVREKSGKITLQAGKKYNLKLEYYENRGKAVCKLLWSSKSQNKQIIPQNRLYPQQNNARLLSQSEKANALFPEEIENELVEVYPNPVSTDYLTISLPDKVENGTLILSTVAGQEVLQKVFTSPQFTLSQHNLPSGVYNLQIVTEALTHTQKIIIP